MGKPIIGGKRLGSGSDGSAAAPKSKNAIESTRRRGRKSGKRTNGEEMVRDIIPTLAHYEWGTRFCFLCRDA
jgi:hypothetical protein